MPCFSALMVPDISAQLSLHISTLTVFEDWQKSQLSSQRGLRGSFLLSKVLWPSPGNMVSSCASVMFYDRYSYRTKEGINPGIYCLHGWRLHRKVDYKKRERKICYRFQLLSENIFRFRMVEAAVLLRICIFKF